MMDKSWLLESRSSYRYKYGLQRFLDFAFHNVAQGDEILCPCKNCNNCSWGNREEVYEHLVCDGFDTSYKKWIFHGEGGSSKKQYEKLNVHDNLDGLLEDAVMPAQFRGNDFEFDDIIDDDSEEFDEETARFYKLVHDARQEAYPGCKNFTKLSIIVRLLHIKNLHGWSNVSFNMLLQLLKELLPENSCLPSTFQECKFIIKDLGCSYEKIHACPNDCILYRKEYENEDACPKCGVSRYKKPEVQKSKRKVSCKVASPPIPAKVLRYFPLKARIQKLFMSSKTANLMKWHQEGRTKDGKLRHPADSLAWKTFDSLHPNFASDPRNVRLGLASDGFNPYKTMSSRYSIWPVVLMTYNLAPWDCMKQPYLMLSLLIPGPSSPKRNIDVYLEPLIDELKELWEKGFETYDASSKQLYDQVAVRRALPKEVARVIIKLGSFFKILCSKVIKVEEFEYLDAEIALILCELERIFPPSFFVLMVHLSIHLAYEARIAGPVHYRWMYPVERFLLRLKNYVRNRSHPEGSIAEGYIADECLTFCSRYLSGGVQTKFNKPPRNLDGPIGHGVMTSLEPLTWEQAHRYVLFNCDITESYVKEHEEFLSSHVYHGLTRKWNQAKDQHLTFHEWFEDRVKNSVACEEVKWLSRGPNTVARRFSAYVVNGYKFVIESCERKTQNYGVMVTSTTMKFRSEKDESPEVENVTYYGVLKDILELDYHGHSKFVLFKCDWFPSKQDNFGLILINFGKQIYENDPFVFATQVKQVYYIEDPSDSWHVVTSTTPRDLFDIYGDLENDDMEKHLEGQLRSPVFDQSRVNEDENVNWFRDDVPGTTIDTDTVEHRVMREESQDDFS